MIGWRKKSAPLVSLCLRGFREMLASMAKRATMDVHGHREHEWRQGLFRPLLRTDGFTLERVISFGCNFA
ncbi:hypothetical protein IQ63_37495 [Streptomyces acidiscabies]|uniref:Uncharacterized protein n=1 Tax=Streptomyces acidiscabies TaxID=42234 RepID=A0A0L0JKN5_9ACTN|nr:hypothetical protein IQ63_37495 [Streptomyces acidiscabies]